MDSGLNTIAEELSAKLFEVTSTFTHPLYQALNTPRMGMMHPMMGGMMGGGMMGGGMMGGGMMAGMGASMMNPMMHPAHSYY